MASYMIFLNKTCFNGLYRTNKNGFFNASFGKYTDPTIFEEQNLLKISEILNKLDVEILNGDFEIIYDKVNDNDFVYFDPPYKPINVTSNFTKYTKESFNDKEQIRLKNFFIKLDEKKAKLMLSNSDPIDNFFDDLYNGFNIERLMANRKINSNIHKRGKVSEILIRNY